MPALWQAVQRSPRTVVLARAWEAVPMSSWQPWQAAEMGGVVLVNPPVLVTRAFAPTFSTRYVPVRWHSVQLRRSPLRNVAARAL